MASRRTAMAISLGLVLFAAAAVISVPHLRVYVGSAPPRQIDEPVGVLLPPGTSARVLGIAHNAGNNLETLYASRAAGADVIEIDVMQSRGRLVAGRPVKPLPGLARALFRGPTLDAAWTAASGTDVKLDLKQDDSGFVSEVIAFLRTHDVPRVLVSTPDPSTLLRLHQAVPHVKLLYSAASPGALHSLQSDPALAAAIAGVSAFEGLVDGNLIAWAHSRRLIVLAWTVNEGPRVAELVRVGVDGVTTANLAVLRALSATKPQ